MPMADELRAIAGELTETAEELTAIADQVDAGAAALETVKEETAAKVRELADKLDPPEPA